MEPGWVGVIAILGFVAILAILNVLEKGRID